MDMQATIRDHATFRTVLQAMSRPGTIQTLPDAGTADPLVILLSSLLDNEVTVAAIDAAGAIALDAISKATGARRCPVAEADFVLVGNGTSNGQLASLRRGTPEYPETGATVIYLLDAVAAEGGSISLSGPGIRDQVAPFLGGLAIDELRQLGEVNRDFPLGVDAMYLDRQGRLACIPRSTRIGVS